MANPSKKNTKKKSSRDIFLASYFDERQYFCFKALQFFSLPENGGIPKSKIREDIVTYAAKIKNSFEKSGIDAWSHYKSVGTCEMLNPSNDFCTRTYLEDKASALNKAGILNENIPWNVDSLAKYFASLNLSALEHFVRFAGKGDAEVAHGVTEQGTIPEEYTVPPEERVPNLTEEEFTASLEATKRKALEKNGKRDPKDFFSVGCYLQYKAIRDFQLPSNGGLSEEQIRQNIFLYTSEVYRIFKRSHVDAWIHYREYGTLEGINPSNHFDTIHYLEAKATALNNAGHTNNGSPWDAKSVARSFKKSHISALEHFFLYAGTGPGEVEQGPTENGDIPEEFRVPDVLHVQDVPVDTFENIESQGTLLPKLPQSKPQISGKQAVALQKEADTAVAVPDKIPEYYFSILPKKTDWNGFVNGLQSELWKKSPARKLIFLFVFVPTILIFLYLLCFASKAYISDAKFAVRGHNTGQGFEGLSTFFNVQAPTHNDSYIVLNYILSYDMFAKLDEKLHLKEHYSDSKLDVWYRLKQNPTHDDIAKFWQWACEVSYDPDTSILELRVKAFTPEKALALCSGILEASEALVNHMNARARKDALMQAEGEVKRAEERIRKAREAMHNYREKTVMLDPQAVASGLYSLVNKLESEVTKTSSELSEALTYIRPGSPRVRQLENRLKVLEGQLATEKKRLAGTIKNDASLNDLLSGFQALMLEEQFAQKQLTSAMTSLETARVRADIQTQYLEAFQRPYLADESLYPRPLLFSCIYMITSLLLLGLFSLIVAAVREHAGF